MGRLLSLSPDDLISTLKLRPDLKLSNRDTPTRQAARHLLSEASGSTRPAPDTVKEPIVAEDSPGRLGRNADRRR